jgi:dolichyl-phosphate-mannose-protein mannosyltransferase
LSSTPTTSARWRHAFGVAPLRDAAGQARSWASSESPWVRLLRGAVPFVAIAGLAMLSRLRYILAYHETYGSGDAHLILSRASLLKEGVLRAPASVGFHIFDDPPLLPLLFAAFSKGTGVSLETTPLILGPALTVIAMLALFHVLKRTTGLATALLATGLVALLPRFSFDSTEPDKSAYVVGFFILALFFLHEGQRRQPLLLVAGLCMGLALFSHTTALFFLPVFALSVPAIALAHKRRVVTVCGVLALLIPFVFIGLYAHLEREYPAERAFFFTAAPTSVPLPDAATGVAPAPPEGESLWDRLLPGRVEQYREALWDDASNGFEEAAGRKYVEAIERHVSTPVFWLAIAGCALAAGALILQRRWDLAPLLLWLLVVTPAFALQRWSFSHGSRYPSYVTPVFVIFACFFAVRATTFLASKFAPHRSELLASALVLPLVMYASYTYVTAPNPGLRSIYGAHKSLVAYIDETALLDDGSHLVYQGWPSTTFFLLEQRPEYIDQIHTFGWGVVPLSRFSPDYLRENNVRYYAQDNVGNDYFGSSKTLSEQLSASFTLQPVALFCSSEGPIVRPEPDDKCTNFVVLFELQPPRP